MKTFRFVCPSPQALQTMLFLLSRNNIPGYNRHCEHCCDEGQTVFYLLYRCTHCPFRANFPASSVGWVPGALREATC